MTCLQGVDTTRYASVPVHRLTPKQTSTAPRHCPGRSRVVLRRPPPHRRHGAKLRSSPNLMERNKFPSQPKRQEPGLVAHVRHTQVMAPRTNSNNSTEQKRQQLHMVDGMGNHTSVPPIFDAAQHSCFFVRLVPGDIHVESTRVISKVRRRYLNKISRLVTFFQVAPVV